MDYKKFECKIEDDRWEPGEKQLTFTHNGFQWQSVAINKEIATKIKVEIDKYLQEKSLTS